MAVHVERENNLRDRVFVVSQRYRVISEQRTQEMVLLQVERRINFYVSQYVRRKMSEGQVVRQQKARAQLHEHLEPLQLVRGLNDWDICEYVYDRFLGKMDVHLSKIIEVLFEFRYVFRRLQQILDNVLLDRRHIEHDSLVAQQNVVLFYLARVDRILNVVGRFD